MIIHDEHKSGYARKIVPEAGQVIELQDDRGEVKAVTWVADTLEYSMNGCFKVRDQSGQIRLVARSRRSRIVPRWRAV